MGRPDMATRPMMTMRMEITMATMGRLMKNLDMVSYLFSAGAGGHCRFRREGLGHNGHSGPDLLGPLGNHLLSGLQALVDKPVGTDPFPDLHRPDIDFVLRSNHSHQVFPLDLGDRPLRHEQGPFLYLHHGPNPAILSGAEQVVLVGKEGPHLEGAGGGINLAICQGKPTFMRINTAIGKDQFAGASGRPYRRSLWSCRYSCSLTLI